MGPADFVVLVIVAALLSLSVRSALRSRKRGCSGCGSASGCSAHLTGGACPAAGDMLRRAEERLGR